MLPFLYLENRNNPVFTLKKFFLTLLKGTIHSLINFFFVIYMTDESLNENGKMGGLWFCSVTLFTNILIIVSIDLLIYTRYHTWINLVILLIVTFIAYIIFSLLVENMSMFNSVGTIEETFSSIRLWMNLILVGGTCGIIDFFILGFNFIYKPSTARELQILLNKKIDMDNINTNELPKKIKEKMENYIEFKGEEENEKIKKEITQRNANNYIEDGKLILKDCGSHGSSDNLNNLDNGISIKDSNRVINIFENGKKSSNNNEKNYKENKFIKNRNNYNKLEQTPSIENSNNGFITKKTSDNTNTNMKKNTISNDFNGNIDLIFYNQENKNKKKKDEENHSKKLSYI